MLSSSSSVKSVTGHNKSVTGFAWSPSSQDILISCSLDKTLKFWDVNSIQCFFNFPLDAPIANICTFRKCFCLAALNGNVYFCNETKDMATSRKEVAIPF
mmetsp:Transcript_27048/g.35474  ORF Transcript_27048/g.35474 Transcript_27048/m.35474 type:complete len:100 (+) Transcript_27048:1-300(+)